MAKSEDMIPQDTAVVVASVVTVDEETKARAYLEAIRWPDGPSCPFCRETQDITAAKAPPGRFRCGSCHATFTVATGSQMEHSRLPLHKWLKLLNQLNINKNNNVVAQVLLLFTMVTTDPGLHIMADGHVIRSVWVAKMVHRFLVPAGTTEITILSRSVVPAELQATEKDFRRLGVVLQEIRLFTDDFSFTWHHSDPALQEGFHAAEPGHRWTNGHAVLPSLYDLDITGPFTLEVQLAESGLNYQLPAQGRRAGL